MSNLYDNVINKSNDDGFRGRKELNNPYKNEKHNYSDKDVNEKNDKLFNVYETTVKYLKESIANIKNKQDFYKDKKNVKEYLDNTLKFIDGLAPVEIMLKNSFYNLPQTDSRYTDTIKQYNDLKKQIDTVKDKHKVLQECPVCDSYRQYLLTNIKLCDIKPDLECIDNYFPRDNPKVKVSLCDFCKGRDNHMDKTDVDVIRFENNLNTNGFFKQSFKNNKPVLNFIKINEQRLMS